MISCANSWLTMKAIRAAPICGCPSRAVVPAAKMRVITLTVACATAVIRKSVCWGRRAQGSDSLAAERNGPSRNGQRADAAFGSPGLDFFSSAEEMLIQSLPAPLESHNRYYLLFCGPNATTRHPALFLVGDIRHT